jgi:HD-like signal output (HDOD) protein
MAFPNSKPDADLDLDARAQLIKRLSSGSLELPVMPATAAQILEACRDDNAGSRRVAEAVNHDPALAAHVLRVANSAAFAPREPVVSMAHAVSLMGLSTISQIALAVCVKGRVFRADGYTKLLAPVWPQATLATGWAREIARLRNGDVEGAFLLGLLHDIGRPVILQALIDIERQSRRTFGEAQALAAMDHLHPRVGADLMRQWNMPEWMSVAIAWHHQPESAPEHREQATLASVSEELARWTLEAGTDGDTMIHEQEHLRELGLDGESLDLLFSARDRIRSNAEALN